MGHIFYKICNDAYLLSRQELQNILVKHQREAGLLWLECEAESWSNSVYNRGKKNKIAIIITY